MVAVASTTYEPTLSRLRVTATGLNASAVKAVVDRSLNGVLWTTVRGGTAAPVLSGALTLPVDDYEFPPNVAITYRVRSYSVGNSLLDTATAVRTVDLQEVWLKFPAAPYLNRTVTLTGWGEISRKSRAGIFQVSARREPIVVTDVHTTRAVSISLRSTDRADTENLDTILSLGVPAYLHVPTNGDLPTMYVAIGDYSYVKPTVRSHRAMFSIPLTEVAAPPASIVGSSSTWQTLIDDYATWNAVLLDLPTWLDVAELIGTPTDIIVGV